MICGGIDLGGTKIEARLFEGPGAATRAHHRIATPTTSYAALLDGLIDQINWLTTTAGDPDLPIGIAVPGIVDPDTGAHFAANVPTSGHTLGADLKAQLNRTFPIINDCMAFALSEAQGGAADGAASVMGLILGTGVGGGYCIGGTSAPRHGSMAVEIGHVGLPAAVLARHDLPTLPCGCGRTGCMETYVSGTGIRNIALQKLGTALSAEALLAARQEDILAIWADIAGECLLTIHLTLAPTCIVLGGGLSNMPGIVERLTQSLEDKRLGDAQLPRLLIAAHGDSSGARGAALLARDTC